MKDGVDVGGGADKTTDGSDDDEDDDDDDSNDSCNADDDKLKDNELTVKKEYKLQYVVCIVLLFPTSFLPILDLSTPTLIQ